MAALPRDKLALAYMLTVIYTEAKSNIAFRRHETLMELFAVLGLTEHLRFFHHKDRNAAMRMTAFISTQFQKSFLTELVSKPRPIALLMDETTDSMAIKTLSVEIMFLENNYPLVYFYRLLKLDADQGAEAIVNKLVKAFEEDTASSQLPLDLEAYVGQNLVAITTDGANTFIGGQSGVTLRLSQRFNNGDGNKIVKIHCFAHR